MIIKRNATIKKLTIKKTNAMINTITNKVISNNDNNHSSILVSQLYNDNNNIS